MSPEHVPHGIRIHSLGWVQRDGGPVEEIRPGDVVWFPPGLKHWHGASSSNGKNVDWMEKVSDEQY